ncbi:MAG: alanine--glyoxylate aminotransferase family protein [Acidobacteria bacterium]|nr:alanine--glyoxylate aminotransferase family protein [Acidobacteriota bacterium]
MKTGFNPGERLLLGPGPSPVPPRVLRALSAPLLGHLDPEFLALMNDIQEKLRRVFCTSNRLTLPISGTGSAGMEACFVNFIDPGDPVVIGVAGVFGERMCDVAQRCGARVTRVEAAWGTPVDLQRLAETIQESTPKLVAIVHAETSTGVHQEIEPLGSFLAGTDALLLVDCVTSLGGMPVLVDDWKIDIAYSGTQKCLSAPPGLAPVTVSEKARAVMRKKKEKSRSWYLDLAMVEKYWGEDRAYHHTAPISMEYALLEALNIVLEEGLQARWQRHHDNHRALACGLARLGLDLAPPPPHRLWSLNAVSVPDGVDEGRVRRQLLHDFAIEIGAGLGPLKGKIWRVGLMGHGSSRSNVVLFLSALEKALGEQGYRTALSGAAEAALAAYPPQA